MVWPVAKGEVNFFLESETRHCTVPIGMSAAAISQ